MANELLFHCGSTALAVQSWGAEGAHPVLAVHGWLDNSSSFEALAQFATRSHIIAADLPGHGRSAHLPANVAYSLENYALTLAALLEQLGWDAFSIIGHSIGASIGIALAASFPERVRHLIMLDALGPMRLSPAESIENLLEGIILSQHKERNTPVAYADLQEAIAVRSIFSKVAQEVVKPITVRDTLPGGAESTLISRFDRRLLPNPNLPYTDKQCHALFERIRCPALLIKGTDGHLTEADVENRKRFFASLVCRDVAGGHHFHAEHPEITANIIWEFMTHNGVSA